MQYKDILKKYISDSGFSLSKIEERMREKGHSTNKSYISKLQNGVYPPAGEDITRALAEITGGDPQPLILAGYIEKAPPEIQDLLKRVSQAEEYLEEQIINFLTIKVKDENNLSAEEKGFIFQIFEDIGVLLFEESNQFKTLEQVRENCLAYSSLKDKQTLLEIIKSYLSDKNIDQFYEDKYNEVQLRHNEAMNYVDKIHTKRDLRMIICDETPLSYNEIKLDDEARKDIITILDILFKKPFGK
ncbi:hypothetical protein [Paenibacillus sp. NPDC058177]|uniref:hypothetical protein n=1 Tax=Paenibacillus sp. NPDC058177 TaxID=3346369 RepID=UPI0036DD44F1